MKPHFRWSITFVAMKRTLPILASVLLFACGNGAENEPVESPAPTAEAAVIERIDLTSVDLPLLLTPPDAAVLAGDSVMVTWNEEFGHVAITGGEHFGLIITEEPGDLQRIKGDLDRDPLRTHTIIEETPSKLVYRSSFPDDADLVFVHFFQLLEADGRQFVVESDPMGRFNEADIARMAASISMKQPA